MIEDAFTHSDNAISITDQYGKLVRVNEAYLHLYKFPKESELLGETEDIIRSPDTPDAVYDEMRSAIASGLIWRGDIINCARDDSDVFIHLTISPIRRKGEIVGYMGFAFNRASQVILEGQLFDANKLAILGTLGAGLAHELNNPLASILLDAEYLRDLHRKMDSFQWHEEAVGAAESVIRGAERMRGVLEHLLLYSKQDSNSAHSTISIPKLLKDSLIFVERQMASNGIDIQIEAPEEIFVIGNRTQLESMILNLLGNSQDAFSAISRKEKRISISVKYLIDRSTAQISYRDNAGGIPETVLARIFEPFFTTKGGKGTGLGLAITQQVVSRHGGTIICNSENQETMFRIFLPAIHADAKCATLVTGWEVSHV